MVSNQTDEMRYANSLSAAKKREILAGLIPIASSAANAQLDAFSLRLSDALMAFSEECNNPKQANLCFGGARMLKKNAYAFYYVSSVLVEKMLRQEVQTMQGQEWVTQAAIADGALELVSYAEMDNKVLLSNVAQPLIVRYADQLQALGFRIASVLGRDEIPLSQNPFRPELFLSVINQAWSEFNPDNEAHSLILPLLQPDVFLDMGPILDALNEALIAHGILPSLNDSYRIKKSSQAAPGGTASEPAATAGAPQKANGPGQADTIVEGSLQAHLQSQLMRITAVSNQLLGFLGGMQKSLLDQQMAGAAMEEQASTAILKNIREQAPQGTLTPVDENTIDLMTKIFEMVFRDQNIAPEMKALIGLLQVPVLKAALIDSDFFFKKEHPARRLVEILSQSSLEWDKETGKEAPIYQTTKNIVERVQQDFDQKMTVFTETVSDLETFITHQETASAESLKAPIDQALKQEKLGHASKVAKTEVAMRIGSGEVVAFVETFLENKWVSVLTVAYSLQEEKPQIVENAVATMDDLIWSVKPKITKEQRKEFLAKLPSILSRLNKWLNVVKWEEADRKQFFAELADTHASIVRAPLPLTPERQLELAVEVAKKAAERRLEKMAQIKPEPTTDEFDEQIKSLERGIWLNFGKPGTGMQKAKLSWVSPMRSLFIFTTNKKEETFQLTDTELAQRFRDGQAHAVELDHLVNRALNQSFAAGARNIKTPEPSVA